MSGNASRILFNGLGALALLGAALSAGGAQLDLTADAVIGKATMTAPPGGDASAANFFSANGATEDPVTGVLWVTDESAHRVLRFSSAAAFASGEAANLVLGQADFTSFAPNRGTVAAANTLNTPVSVAVDQAGRLYVSDFNNHRVLVFRPPFTSGMGATAVIGQADFATVACNRGGAVTAGRLCFPNGIALDRTGNLFVSDQGNNRVVKYAAPAVTGAVATKVFGQAGSFTTNAATTTAAGLKAPFQVATDAADNLWVADLGNHRVLFFDLGAAGGDTTADLVLCQATFTTSTAGTAADACSGPTGVAVDAGGNVYVADFYNSRVLRFTTLADGASATAVIGQPGFASSQCNRGGGAPAANALCNPYLVSFDRMGNLLVGDYSNDRLLRYDLPLARAAPAIVSLSPEGVPQGSGTFTLTVNGTGFYGSSVVNWNGSPRATAYLSDRRLLAQIPAADVAGAGPVPVTVTNPEPGGGTSATMDFVPYARASQDATADRVLGQPGFTSSAGYNPQVGEEQLGTANPAVLNYSNPLQVAIDRVSGRLFVSNLQPSDSRVLSWPNASAFHNAQPADVVLGQPDEFSKGCNTGALGASTLCMPYGLAIDAAGALYVADYNNHRILKFAPPFATGMAATQVFGQAGSFTTATENKGGLGADSLSGPQGLAVSAGALFAYDSGNNRILVFNNPGADTTADAAIGQPDLTTAVLEPASATRFSGLDGNVAVDAGGRLYLANTQAGRVIRFSPPFASNMGADLVIGQPDFTSTVLATTASRLRGPFGLAFDADGNLMVSDWEAHRILRYAAPLASGMAATGVLGQADYVTGTSGTSATKMARPLGLAFDSLGNLVVADYYNARVLAFDRPFLVPLDPAGDADTDGIPNGVEVTESRDPYVKDNDIFTVNRLFAMQQYRDFLGREGDEGGIAYYGNLLDSNPQLRGPIIESFFNSPEFSGSVSPVVRLYFAFFSRIPDYAGLQYQVNALRTGTPLTVIANNFTLSPEFVATYGSLTDSQYVALLYANVLGRAASQGEIDYHVARLASGVTRGEVMAGFSESPEYLNGTYSRVYVVMMYVGMLHRSPEQAGFDYWVNYRDTGNPGINLILGFLNAPEYHNRFLP